MSGAEIDTSGHLEALRRLLTESRQTREHLRKIMKEALKEARKQLKIAASQEIASDPRLARNAVRMTMYKREIGGSVHILSKRKAGENRAWSPPRKLRAGQHGGNRRPRSERTERADSYRGADRGFVLRFLELGTKERSTIHGARGRISARSWFASASPGAMRKTADLFGKMVADYMNERWRL